MLDHPGWRLSLLPLEKKKRESVKSSEHYISYLPRDVHSEKGLSIASSFDQQASGAVLDLDGDDETAFQKPRQKMQW